MSEKKKLELFEHICHIYREDLQNFIFSLTRKDLSAMEEIYQETMMKAYINLRKLKDESKIKSWVFSIAAKEARRYYHTNKKYYHYEFGELNEDFLLLSDYKDFTENITNQELILQTLNEFPEDIQTIFFQHYYHGLPLAEIARMLNNNENTIRTVHSRTLSRIKDILIRKGDFR